MAVDPSKLHLDRYGVVLISDADLATLEREHFVSIAGGTSSNAGCLNESSCTGTTNGGCINNGMCNGTLNMGPCENREEY